MSNDQFIQHSEYGDVDSDAPPGAISRKKTSIDRLILLGVIVGCFFVIFLAILFYSKSTKNVSVNAVDSSQSISDRQTNTEVVSASLQVTKDELRRRMEREQMMLDAQNTQSIKPEPPRVLETAKAPRLNASPVKSRLERQRNGDVLLTDFSNGAESQASSVGQGPPASQSQASVNAVNAELVLPAIRANLLPDMDFLLKQGTVVPCVLKTGIDTTLPGIVLCNVTDDVYSANGKSLLIERGATVFGEQTTSLKNGQARTFVMWNRLDNADGVSIKIGSPAADRMGFSGIPGYVDNHFWERFGNALLVSMILDYSDAVADRIQDQPAGDTLVLDNTRQATESIAVEILRSSGNIPPTLIVNPATVINIMVSKDISFDNVYDIVE
jgi:type IV secretion system protein VirB10